MSITSSISFGKIVEKPTPMILLCRYCYAQHIDLPPWDTEPHRTHKCSKCASEWRPALIPTVGVKNFIKEEHKAQTCLHRNTTWVDAAGRVTHDAFGWPPRVADYCYDCFSYIYITKLLQLGGASIDPKTSDYCTVCGESPESATHIVLRASKGGHAYVKPSQEPLGTAASDDGAKAQAADKSRSGVR